MRSIAFIVPVIAFLCLILLGPWSLSSTQNDNTDFPEELFDPDSIRPNTFIPSHEYIFNQFSDLTETKRLDKTVERFMQQWDIAGASLAIMKEGKLIYAKGYGYADRESETPVGVNHIFRIASLSKLITAAAIMKLSEEGKLSLSDKVFGKNGILNDSDLLEIKDKQVKNITVEHLLRHQGGFSERSGDPMFNPIEIAREMEVEAPADLRTIIRYVLKKRLGFTPGSGTNYSNIGYGILSQVIEKVSCQSYESYVQENILYPAGCYDMHLGRNTRAGHYTNEVKYYEPSNAEKIRICSGEEEYVLRSDGGNNIEALSGAGGWVASPTELLRFIQAIDGDPTQPDILSQESIEQMTAYQPGGLPIGWMHTYPNGDWYRSGSLAGTSAMMKRQGDGFSWVFITNTSNWTGPRFPKKIEGMVNQAMCHVKEWPSRDLFNPEFCKELLNESPYLSLENNNSTQLYPPDMEFKVKE